MRSIEELTNTSMTLTKRMFQEGLMILARSHKNVEAALDEVIANPAPAGDKDARWRETALIGGAILRYAQDVDSLHQSVMRLAKTYSDLSGIDRFERYDEPSLRLPEGMKIPDGMVPIEMNADAAQELLAKLEEMGMGDGLKIIDPDTGDISPLTEGSPVFSRDIEADD